MSIILDQLKKTTCTTDQDSLNKSKLVAKRYSLFLKQKTTYHSPSCNIHRILNLIGKFWNLLVPIKIRGVFSQYEQLKEYLGRNMDDLSKDSIEQNLQGKRKTVVLGYKRESVEEMDVFLKENKVIKILKENKIQICPLQIKKSKDIKIWQTKVQQFCFENDILLQFPIFIPVWKGLFEELIMLSVVEVCDHQAYEKMCEAFIKQLQYEQKIKYMIDGDKNGRMEESSDLDFVSHSYKVLKQVERSNLK